MNPNTRKTLFSSLKMDWETPQDLFDRLNQEFSFTHDACATEQNKKCNNYISPETNALLCSWEYGRYWMNPPYGKLLSKFVEKARQQAFFGRVELICCLIPSRTDTKYWHRECMRAAEIRFIQGRLQFHGAAAKAPFPSAIVIFRENHEYLTPPRITSYQAKERK